MVGAAVGLVAAMPIYAAQLAGQLMGYQVGLGLGSLYNPALDTEADVLGQLMLYMGMAIFVGVGGLESAFLAVAHTFENVPMGGSIAAAAPLELLAGLAGSGFEVASERGMPAAAIER